MRMTMCRLWSIRQVWVEMTMAWRWKIGWKIKQIWVERRQTIMTAYSQ